MTPPPPLGVPLPAGPHPRPLSTWWRGVPGGRGEDGEGWRKAPEWGGPKAGRNP